jgi:hypothetical protein
MAPLQYAELMARGYLMTILLEGAVLFLGLRDLTVRQKLFLSIWLTAITYPFVWLVYPCLFDMRTERVAYLWAAETFAPLAECLAFRFAFAGHLPWRSGALWRSFAVITAANLTSYIVGALVPWYR